LTANFACVSPESVLTGSTNSRILSRLAGIHGGARDRVMSRVAAAAIIEAFRAAGSK